MTVNMFKALRIEQNEVMMCRFLADLLDPHGWHGYRAKFLKSFLRDVIKLGNFEDTLLERTCVMTEYLIEKDRRIDIMLQNPEFSIPIEAKINARDQQSQCYDYQPYTRNAQLVYLTKEGTPQGGGRHGGSDTHSPHLLETDLPLAGGGIRPPGAGEAVHRGHPVLFARPPKTAGRR